MRLHVRGEYGTFCDFLRWEHRFGESCRPAPTQNPKGQSIRVLLAFLETLHPDDREGDVDNILARERQLLKERKAKMFGLSFFSNGTSKVDGNLVDQALMSPSKTIQQEKTSPTLGPRPSAQTCLQVSPPKAPETTGLGSATFSSDEKVAKERFDDVVETSIANGRLLVVKTKPELDAHKGVRGVVSDATIQPTEPNSAAATTVCSVANAAARKECADTTPRETNNLRNNRAAVAERCGVVTSFASAASTNIEVMGSGAKYEAALSDQDVRAADDVHLKQVRRTHCLDGRESGVSIADVDMRRGVPPLSLIHI